MVALPIKYTILFLLPILIPSFSFFHPYNITIGMYNDDISYLCIIKIMISRLRGWVNLPESFIVKAYVGNNGFLETRGWKKNCRRGRMKKITSILGRRLGTIR